MLFAIKCHASPTYLASVPDRRGNEWTADLSLARKFSTAADLESYAAGRGLSKYEPMPVNEAWLLARSEEMAREFAESHLRHHPSSNGVAQP